tara:strand:+ start:4015 stop:4410 length:396 start_codon:yes stop_codon:yes gene_type:complete
MNFEPGLQRREVAQGDFRSGLERRIAKNLGSTEYEYERWFLRYTVPSRVARYTPDFVLANGIVVEAKGRFVAADRNKHLLIRDQHPDLDLRFVFSNSKTRITKRSRTSYGDWCEKHGFIYADRTIPEEWVT